MPYVARAISSNQLKSIKRQAHAFKRNVLKLRPTLDVFLKVDDPYSFLLVQVLSSVEARFDVDLNYHVFDDFDPEMFPRMEMWREYAAYDAYHLAQLYDIEFPEHPQKSERKITERLALQLVEFEGNENFLTISCKLLHSFWFAPVGESELPKSIDKQQCQKNLKQNAELLAEKGHYLGAMIHFENEWYWGVDRLDHLESRLIENGLSKSAKEEIYFNRTYRDFCTHALPHPTNKNKPLTLYWSARSPYSYLALEKAVQLATFHKITLDIKPVLPMMMRNMNVPQTKKMYIFLDTKREAQKQGILYGFVADPLGEAVERCYALLDYAHSQKKLHEFLLSFARGVNAEGIRAETDRGMHIIVERCGLNWAEAKAQLSNTLWKHEVQKNLDEMFELGCWGVPTICYGDQYFWGQDRFGILENHIISTGIPST